MEIKSRLPHITDIVNFAVDTLRREGSEVTDEAVLSLTARAYVEGGSSPGEIQSWKDEFADQVLTALREESSQNAKRHLASSLKTSPQDSMRLAERQRNIMTAIRDLPFPAKVGLAAVPATAIPFAPLYAEVVQSDGPKHQPRADVYELNQIANPSNATTHLVQQLIRCADKDAVIVEEGAVNPWHHGALQKIFEQRVAEFNQQQPNGFRLLVLKNASATEIEKIINEVEVAVRNASARPNEVESQVFRPVRMVICPATRAFRILGGPYAKSLAFQINPVTGDKVRGADDIAYAVTGQAFTSGVRHRKNATISDGLDFTLDALERGMRRAEYDVQDYQRAADEIQEAKEQRKALLKLLGSLVSTIGIGYLAFAAFRRQFKQKFAEQLQAFSTERTNQKEAVELQKKFADIERRFDALFDNSQLPPELKEALKGDSKVSEILLTYEGLQELFQNELKDNLEQWAALTPAFSFARREPRVLDNANREEVVQAISDALVRLTGPLNADVPLKKEDSVALAKEMISVMERAHALAESKESTLTKALTAADKVEQSVKSLGQLLQGMPDWVEPAFQNVDQKLLEKSDNLREAVRSTRFEAIESAYFEMESAQAYVMQVAMRLGAQLSKEQELRTKVSQLVGDGKAHPEFLEELSVVSGQWHTFLTGVPNGRLLEERPATEFLSKSASNILAIDESIVEELTEGRQELLEILRKLKKEGLEQGKSQELLNEYDRGLKVMSTLKTRDSLAKATVQAKGVKEECRKALQRLIESNRMTSPTSSGGYSNSGSSSSGGWSGGGSFGGSSGGGFGGGRFGGGGAGGGW